MGDQVRVDHMGGFGTFAQGMQETKAALRPIGTHRHLELPPVPARPLADMTGPFNNLGGSSSAGVTRFTSWVTRADSGLSGLAFVATYIAKNFTETDEVAADRLRVGELGRDAEDNVPPVPPPAPGTDPAQRGIVSQPETLDERRQRLAIADQPGQPGQPGQPV